MSFMDISSSSLSVKLIHDNFSFWKRDNLVIGVSYVEER